MIMLDGSGTPCADNAWRTSGNTPSLLALVKFTPKNALFQY